VRALPASINAGTQGTVHLCAGTPMLERRFDVTMTTKAPPVPKDNRSRKAPPGGATQKDTKASPGEGLPDNPEEQGETGNIRQNTITQGLRRNR
jgi:hypothetical protein